MRTLKYLICIPAFLLTLAWLAPCSAAPVVDEKEASKILQENKYTKEEAEKKAKTIAANVDKVKSGYTTVISDFNGNVSVTAADTNMEVLLSPGEGVEVPKGMPIKRGVISWKDIAKYESAMVINPRDAYTKWFIENLWRDRINKVLAILETKLTKEQIGEINAQSDKAGKDLLVEAISDELGIPSESLIGEPRMRERVH